MSHYCSDSDNSDSDTDYRSPTSHIEHQEVLSRDNRHGHIKFY